MKFKVGNTVHFEQTMINCEYSNDTCYEAKILPVVSSIDAT